MRIATCQNPARGADLLVHVRRSALVRIAWPTGSTAPGDLTFVGQVGNPDFGRPDIVGTYPLSRTRFLIQAKFVAGLTPQQPNGYLELLAKDVPGQPGGLPGKAREGDDGTALSLLGWQRPGPADAGRPGLGDVAYSQPGRAVVAGWATRTEDEKECACAVTEELR